MKAIINSDIFYKMDKLLGFCTIEVLVKNKKVSIIAANKDIQVIIDEFSRDGKEDGYKIIPSYLAYAFDRGIELMIESSCIRGGNSTVNIGKWGEKTKVINVDSDRKIVITSMREAMKGKYALSRSNENLVLQAMAIKKKSIYATDRCRISKTGLDISEIDHEEILIPLSVVNIIAKMKEVDICSISQDKEYIKFDFGDIKIISKRIMDRYIDIESYICKKDRTHICIDADELRQAVIKGDLHNPENIYLNIYDDNVNVTTEVEAIGVLIKTKVKAKIGGDKLRILFNSKFLIEALERYSGMIDIYFGSSIEPMTIIQDNKLDLILPLRADL